MATIKNLTLLGPSGKVLAMSIPDLGMLLSVPLHPCAYGLTHRSHGPRNDFLYRTPLITINRCDFGRTALALFTSAGRVSSVCEASGCYFAQRISFFVFTSRDVRIKSLLEVTAAKLMLLVYKLLLLVLKVNAASTKVTTTQRLRLLKELLLSEENG
ncbi:hypothetical protein Tco_0681172 [Tanacetum coccineum]|uniref:Uncharacterized protein n=1 Tax=Tanacetum coccineum TaxID=301880 RepID=A0ABQ4XNT3_9ASTR